MRDPLTLLQAAVAANPRGIQGVSEEAGYSRTALSLYLSGKYGSAAKLEAAILLRYNRRECPHTGEDLAAETCRRRALTPQPFGGHARLAQWTACQTCPHKPTENPS